MSRRARHAPRVYPRVCGGAHRVVRQKELARGLSPRVRGSHGAGADGQRALGSIPACAGEPGGINAAQMQLKVYPRVCGGAMAAALMASLASGLSPRVRGEPARFSWTRSASRVYPRVCGGARPRIPADVPLSGSIPACAGEPRHGQLGITLFTVYPRVCGGAMDARVRTSGGRGLSPRVRGSRGTASSASRCSRSIPACAGEPRATGARPIRGRVYPRVCGGAIAFVEGRQLGLGLSPRVRGSHGR